MTELLPIAVMGLAAVVFQLLANRRRSRGETSWSPAMRGLFGLLVGAIVLSLVVLAVELAAFALEGWD